MYRFFLSLMASVLFAAPVLAHNTSVSPSSRTSVSKLTVENQPRFIQLLKNLVETAHAAGVVRITIENGYRIIQSDGIPQHATGRFPNSGNPNRISEQNHKFRMPASPRKTGRITRLVLSPFGVAINGVPFDPGAAEFWKNDRQSGWQYEALSGAVELGVDQSNAHVQPNGAYHYHGMPTGLVERLGEIGVPLLLGYAADGFPIYGPMGYRQANKPESGMKTLTASYGIKSGNRSGGPGGNYDGSFVQDYEYIAGKGDLDECNGRSGTTNEYPSGTYYYVITGQFPFIPRCFKATPDQSFAHGPRTQGGRGDRNQGRRPEQGQGTRQGQSTDRRGPGGGPPAEAIQACQGKSEGDTISFRTPRGHTVQGICQSMNGQMIAKPAGGRRPPAR